MRLLAVDYLIEHDVDPKNLRQALAAADRAGGWAVSQRARDYLMAASTRSM